MFPWNCCRTCLSIQNLNPIFTVPEKSEKFTNAIFTAIGIKIELSDNLPQYMCSGCINFVNDINKFRKKADETQKQLISRLQNDQFDNLKEESYLKLEPEVRTEIYLEEDCEDFKDYDYNITLDNFQYEINSEKLQEKTEEFESTVQDIVEKPIDIVFSNNNDKKKIVREKSVKRKTRAKKENTEETKKRVKEKGERVKEQIECEYCHKILTSKLSLRNHYKIHTGFDVVCEHCGKKFITRRLLLMHCRAKHGYEKTDKCSYCDYKASNAEQVKIHERLHTGEKPFVCKQCGASFHRRSSYLQHIAIHLPEKTVQCDLCPSLFKSVTLMRIHRSRHRAGGGTRPSFRCSICGGTFARRRNVARHLQRAHRMTPEPQHIHRVDSV